MSWTLSCLKNIHRLSPVYFQEVMFVGDGCVRLSSVENLDYLYQPPCMELVHSDHFSDMLQMTQLPIGLGS